MVLLTSLCQLWYHEKRQCWTLFVNNWTTYEATVLYTATFLEWDNKVILNLEQCWPLFVTKWTWYETSAFDSLGLQRWRLVSCSTINEQHAGRQCWYFSLSVEQHAGRQCWYFSLSVEQPAGRQCWYFSLSVEQHAGRQSSPLAVSWTTTHSNNSSH